MNRLCAIGRLGADPEVKTTRGGTTVLELRFAIDARTKVGESWETVTTWVRTSLFGRRAEALDGRLSKGDRIGITGSLVVREYEKRDGSKGYSVEVIDPDVTLLGSGRSERTVRDRTRSDFGGGGDFGGDDFGDDDSLPFATSAHRLAPHDPTRGVL